MGKSDFYIDYNIEVSGIPEEFAREIEESLRQLASSHSDMIGAAVALEKTVDTRSYDVFRVRIVVYKRPQDVVVAKEGADPMVTLREVLEVLEEQIRESREKLSQKDTHRDTQIRCCKCRRIIDPITHEPHDVTLTLERLDDPLLVHWRETRKNIGPIDSVG